MNFRLNIVRGGAIATLFYIELINAVMLQPSRFCHSELLQFYRVRRDVLKHILRPLLRPLGTYVDAYLVLENCQAHFVLDFTV